jgi:hypothetical protein
MSHIEFVRNVRNGRSAYHHHKEQMAFGAAALYITGTTALLFTEDKFWNELLATQQGLFFAAIFITSICWICFVYWQFANRLKAATMVAACDTLLSKWVRPNTRPPSDAEYGLEDYEGDSWPKFLVDELNRQRNRIDFVRNIGQSNAWVYVVMFIWFLLLFARVISTN